MPTPAFGTLLGNCNRTSMQTLFKELYAAFHGLLKCFSSKTSVLKQLFADKSVSNLTCCAAELTAAVLGRPQEAGVNECFGRQLPQRSAFWILFPVFWLLVYDGALRERNDPYAHYASHRKQLGLWDFSSSTGLLWKVRTWGSAQHLSGSGL